MKDSKRKLWLERELFEIPYDGKAWIVYAPLKGIAFLANRSLLNRLCDLRRGARLADEHDEALQELRRLGIVADGPPANRSQTHAVALDAPFLPLSLTLFLTGNCNLACPYCYASGGERKINMPLDMALDAVDLLFAFAEQAKAREINLSFHGGGEPLLRLSTMGKAVERARRLAAERGLCLTIGLTSNGAMSPKAREWVVGNVDQLNISFDGPPEIQNLQRPMRNGVGSFRRVAKTLKTLEKRRRPYHLRGTVTRFSQDRIPEIVHFMIEHFKPAAIHLEPMFSSTRASQAHLEGPDPDAFARGFLEAGRIARRENVTLYFSGDRFPRVGRAFCGIGWKNFAVTPEGWVTSCFEVLEKNDHRSATFIYGNYVPGSGFAFDAKKIRALRVLSGREFPYCRDCFAKFHCAGDCRAKGLYKRDEAGFRGGGRCEIIRAITRARLLDRLKLSECG